ncbi:MAG: hypothetical protein LBV33_04125, partial [Lachnospiraceae bacterium]|nr:hypothetical protein [Lachnospiraceae bacterium]
MGFIKKILNRFKKKEETEHIYEDWEELVYRRDELMVHDRDQRREYVKNCLEQIAEATREVDSLQMEYNSITSQLKDMEEIDALPEEEHRELEEAARQIGRLEGQRSGYLKRSNRMGEAQYQKMEALADEVKEGSDKLTAAEDYQTKIRADMKRLENEKDAYLYRKHEAQRQIENLKGMSIVCVIATVLCFILLLVLQMGFGMDAQIGYLLTAGAAALVITVVFFRHTEAIRELKKVEKSINKIIQLHNAVKIRYVNNTNLLEYLRLKYGVSGAEELDKLWQQYQTEKAERDKFKQAERELEIFQRELLHILRRYQVRDPGLWLHQTAAILDNKEMVEIRHNLIIRRQSLRRRIDYNNEVVAHNAQAEIKDLAEKYP